MSQKVLISTVGEVPEVVTEVLDKLLEQNQSSQSIGKVVVVTTNDDDIREGREKYILETVSMGESVEVHRGWAKGIRQGRERAPMLEQCRREKE